MTIVSSGQTISVTSGQTDVGDIVLSGGDLVVFPGGTASATIVDSGGTENVLSGGIADGTAVNSSGNENVSGTASGTTINSGGTETVANGGTASATIVGSGGFEFVRRNQDVAAVTFDERTAAVLPDEICDVRSEEASDRAGDCDHLQLEAAGRNQVARERHDDLGGQRDACALDRHHQDDAGVA